VVQSVVSACDRSRINAASRDARASVREVAELLGVHPQTVRRLIHEGRLESIRVGGRLFVPRAALDELVARQRRKP
jgi:excisionase family DNA binding protein